MDKLSIAGIALALLAVFGGQILEGGHLGSLLQFAAFTIVVGGTLAAVMLQSPLHVFMDGMRLARWIVVPPALDIDHVIASIMRWASVARKEGMLALENSLAAVDDSFLLSGLRMLVDGFDGEKITETMQVEITGFEERYRAAARVWESAGGYAPTIGILGAVIGLIHVMENLTDPAKLGEGIAVAFVSTVYGVGSANLFFIPMANKLKALIRQQVLRRELVLDGLLGIANGENPKIIAARLEGYFRG